MAPGKGGSKGSAPGRRSDRPPKSDGLRRALFLLARRPANHSLHAPGVDFQQFRPSPPSILSRLPFPFPFHLLCSKTVKKEPRCLVLVLPLDHLHNDDPYSRRSAFRTRRESGPPPLLFFVIRGTSLRRGGILSDANKTEPLSSRPGREQNNTRSRKVPSRPLSSGKASVGCRKNQDTRSFGLPVPPPIVRRRASHDSGTLRNGSRHPSTPLYRAKTAIDPC